MGLSVRDADTLAAVCHAARTGAEYTRTLAPSGDFVLSSRNADGGGWRSAMHAHLQQPEDRRYLEEERVRVEEAQGQTLEVLHSLLSVANDRVAALAAPSQQWWESAEWAEHAQLVPRGVKAAGRVADAITLHQAH